ncbi:MAG: sialate O-acetylesterase, partial [Planctomycetaceae bacterium]|nr:sialate O-acetylesterase [Planctomycetaceae bacterium]
MSFFPLQKRSLPVCFLLPLAAVILFFGAAPVFAEFRLPEIFGENMVLQCGNDIPIWGWAEPGDSVSVIINNRTPVPPAPPGMDYRLANPVQAYLSPVVDKSGRWTIQIKKLHSGGPYSISVRSTKENKTIELKNVFAGDVWLCSGQSNMEWTVKQSAEFKETMESADNPRLRLFHIAKAHNKVPQEQLKLVSSWRESSRESVPQFSAVGYYFGSKLNVGVPIGLINASWGGTRIEPWIPPAGFQSVPALKKIADALALEDPPYHKNTDPATLYNAMIHPMLPFAIKGVIWYQGEANLGDGMMYAEKMKALIQGWRTVFNNPDLGFYYVQLAPFHYGGDPMRLPEIWEAQSSIEKEIPKTGQVVINDLVTNIKDIHPTQKKPVGERLASLVLQRYYNSHRQYPEAGSPVFDKLQIDGSTAVVYFKNAEELKTRDGKSPDWFEIAGEDGHYHKAEAVIDGITIKLTSAEV